MADQLKVLLIGGGGREHALAYAIHKSPLLEKLYIAPGNPGTETLGENIALNYDDRQELLSFVRDHNIDLTVVGPEDPLVGGIVDILEEQGHKAFGPSRYAAQLEGSKAFAKRFMKDYSIPTADYATFASDNFKEARSYLREEVSFPVVLKADGLAGGKGVFVCQTKEEALSNLDYIQADKKISKAAEKLVIEEFLEGEEASVFVISDGEEAKIIGNAQDHKRIGEGDTGLNTGGMGAYSPAPVVTNEVLEQVASEIIRPTIDGMIQEGAPYKGILYLGLMITGGGPKVVEYNCRMGDPECQAILPRLNSDWLQAMWNTVQGRLDEVKIELDDNYYCCVVMASDGYPGEYEKGKEIKGLDRLRDEDLVFHSGTKRQDGKILTDGGRVLSVVNHGDTLREAVNQTYQGVRKIHFENAYYRRDIAHKGMAREENQPGPDKG